MSDLTLHKVIETAVYDSSLVGCFCIEIKHKKRHMLGEKYKSPKQMTLWQYSTKHAPTCK